jgi:hypothetical protein
MKKLLFAVVLAVAALPAFATILIVDINGAGQFTSIQTAIDNATPGDTIQVWPGTYNGAINMNKNVVLQGSGYENTIITATSNPTITMSNGLIKWFMVSSTMGRGIDMSGGKVVNCVIKGCSSTGIYSINGLSYIQNCIVINNGDYGISSLASNSTIFVTNTISRNNTNPGFRAQGSGTMYRSYCNGSIEGYGGAMLGGQGCIDSDPIFNSTTNYHLSSGSPCINTGQPSLSDPDGSISDMGYFGGTDCPIFPVVYEMTITPNGSNINVQAKARANY